MSRTMLCAFTAAGLTVFAVAVILTRWCVLGDSVHLPAGAAAWKVTMVVQGASLGAARLTTAVPLDLERQHVLKDEYTSPQLLSKPPEARKSERRQVIWTRRGGAAAGPFHARCTFHVVPDGSHADAAAARLTTDLYAAPKPGKMLEPERRAEDNARIAAQARALTDDLDAGATLDRAEALYHFVDRTIANEPSVKEPVASAADCLENESGDCGAKSRLLAALLRCRGVPARLVAGVTLTKGPEQRAHYWVEAWLDGRWLPMCPFHHHFGHVPGTYLIFGYGEHALVQGSHIKDLDYAFLVERLPGADSEAGASPLKRVFLAVSLYRLPPAERRLVEVLLLLPAAAVVISLFRNVIGLMSFGAFAPALIGLAFRGGLGDLPGVLVFVTILLIGWLMRRVLDRYHLLQVPRVAVMLTLIMALLIAAVVAANRFGAPTTSYISLFPLIILTSMVERFWTIETEDGAGASFRTLFQTMLISTVIALTLSIGALSWWLFSFPETLLIIIAAQMLIGRYTGHRLTELFRFRALLTRLPV
jgi:7 transmembrane helices usually fused to an inactive transglutaminase/Transglutaminase-like superfamily